MFKLEPFYNFDRQDVELPKCMFKMEKIVGGENVILPGECGSGNIDIQDLLRRQDKIFEELAGIEGQVKALQAKFGIQTPTASAITKTASGGTRPDTEIGDVIHDIVIYANPASPPYSLIFLYRRLREQYTCRTAVHTHSSVQSVPEKLLGFGNGIRVERPSAQIALTLIWKDVKYGPEMRVNPSSQTPICGEANIARYVARLINPGYEADIHTASLVDQWLDVASFSLIGGNSKERAAAVRSMNSYLGKRSWLVGDEASFIDAVLYSTLQQTGQITGASGNVKNWVKACERLEPFQQIKALVG